MMYVTLKFKIDVGGYIPALEDKLFQEMTSGISSVVILSDECEAYIESIELVGVDND